MQRKAFERDISAKYAELTGSDVQNKIHDLFAHIQTEWNKTGEELSQSELKIVTDSVIEHETKALHDDVERLLAEKERIERQLERQRDSLQDAKYAAFDAIEKGFGDKPSMQLMAKLHYIKLQSIDLFDVLEEMVESAVITTLEKGQHTALTIEEITKDITYETLSEGPLSPIRIRKVIATILQTATNVADAVPNSADEILRGTLKGIRSGLVSSISRFKKQLLYMPEESRELVTDGFDVLQAELQRADLLFNQVVQGVATTSSGTSRALLDKISKELHLDLDELLQISKETVDVMRQHISKALKQSNKVLQSERAKEAKRMGAQAWGATKTAISSAIQTAREKIDKDK